METIIYHNTMCSKSREGLCILEEIQEDVIIREYMKEPLSYEEIDELLKLLNVKPLAIIRQKEDIFKEKFEGKKRSRQQWIKAMVKYPELIERPIVVRNGKATVGRPPELILELFK
jgi:arsenate reductase (glutaredoxin)